MYMQEKLHVLDGVDGDGMCKHMTLRAISHMCSIIQSFLNVFNGGIQMNRRLAMK